MESITIGRVVSVNGHSYHIEKLLGKGKGGYSWLASLKQQQYVLKALHHEPCSYYHFDDKFQSELDAYSYLMKIGIPTPEMIDKNREQEIIIKQYIHGKTLSVLSAEKALTGNHWSQLRQISDIATGAQINPDWFPTNFVEDEEHKLWYIDYECNPYSEEWNLTNWGMYFYLNSEGMRKYNITMDTADICDTAHPGKPLKAGLESSRELILRKHFS
jgi:hypothetical protein